MPLAKRAQLCLDTLFCGCRDVIGARLQGASSKRNAPR
jgi:hypothetical protein